MVFAGRAIWLALGFTLWTPPMILPVVLRHDRDMDRAIELAE